MAVGRGLRAEGRGLRTEGRGLRAVGRFALWCAKLHQQGGPRAALPCGVRSYTSRVGRGPMGNGVMVNS